VFDLHCFCCEHRLFFFDKTSSFKKFITWSNRFVAVSLKMLENL
jgi:hypothetical protein